MVCSNHIFLSSVQNLAVQRIFLRICHTGLIIITGGKEGNVMKDVSGFDEDGKPKHGPFKLYFKNGSVSCEGEFNNGKKSGKWKYFLNNGQLQSTGHYQDGKIWGQWTWFYKNGEPRGIGGFDDDEQKHGLWKRYHPNGQLWDEGHFEHGKKTGTWKVYGEKGELMKTQNFK
jgi:antitoxin component YwqK of YwqJK toxin-antitoxin module